MITHPYIALVEVALIGVFIYGLFREKTIDGLRHKTIHDLTLNEIVFVLLLLVIFVKVIFDL